MKNLQVGDNDLIGNRFNGHDLHIALRQRGIEASHVVKLKRSDDPHTHQFDDAFVDSPEFESATRLLEHRYDTHSLHSPLSFSLLSNPLFLDADIVHYHLLHNAAFNLSLLPTLTALKPSVWTIHDPWPLTGHCIYPLDCERWKIGCGECPYLATPFPLQTDTTALNWQLKQETMQRCQIDLIVASQFMLEMVRQSPILSHLTTHLVPFGIDLTHFSPADPREAKRRLGIPADHTVLCFRADNSPFKGFSFVQQALRQLDTTTPVTLLTVGMTGLLEEFSSRFTVIDAGWLTDDDRMLDVYRAADVFLMPSVAEAFGMMAIEAMACGKPVIAFEGTSLPEVLAAPEGGVVVGQGDVEALTQAIRSLVTTPAVRHRLGEQARRIAVQRYDKDRYVSRIIEVYEAVIAARKPNARADYILSQQRQTVGPRGDLPRLAPAITSDTAAPSQTFKASPHYAFYTRIRQRRGLRLAAVVAVRPLAYLAWRLTRLR